MITVTRVAPDTRVIRAESPAELAAGVAAESEERAAARANARSVIGPAKYKNWAGVTREQAIRDGLRGDVSLVGAAQAMLSELECLIDAPRSQWVPSRAGAYPIVPEALAGFPDSMRRRVPAYDSSSPLRVVVDLTASVSITAEQIARRGMAYLALAMFLANERAVTLDVVVGNDDADGSHGLLVVTSVPAQPLDLAVACSALTSAGFLRVLGYETCYRYATGNHSGHYPWGTPPFSNAARAKYSARIREILGLAADDVYAPPAHYNDPAINDPVAFVRRAIEEHAAKREVE